MMLCIHTHAQPARTALFFTHLHTDIRVYAKVYRYVALATKDCRLCIIF